MLRGSESARESERDKNGSALFEKRHRNGSGLQYCESRNSAERCHEEPCHEEPRDEEPVAKYLVPPSSVAAAREPKELTDRQRAIHALSRLTFGPRPGDVDAVLSKGVNAWIEDQLHPESIDDSALNARLAPYATTRMSLKQLAEAFPSDAVIRQLIAGKRMMPADPALKLVYAVNAARIEQQDANKTSTPPAAGAAATGANASASAQQWRPPRPTRSHHLPKIRLDPSATACWRCQRISASQLEENDPAEELVNLPNRIAWGAARPAGGGRDTPRARDFSCALSQPRGVLS